MPDLYISAAKRAWLARLMERTGVLERDLVEQFVHSSGPGGQKVNKASSCVRLKHEKSGIDVKCQQSRSRELNRYLARRELCERLEERQAGAESRRRAEIEKIRRRKRRRSYRQKQRMLQDKREQSAKKQRRAPVDADGE